MEIKRGEIYEAQFYGTGSEQKGVRPCLIIQNDNGNTYSNTTVVIPITSKMKRYNKTHVDIDCLRDPSRVLCEQVRVMDKSLLIKRVTMLSDEKMAEVEKKLLITLGMV